MPCSEGTDAPAPVGRLAPSPTGRLHLGHARSFLLAWWSARAAGGRVVLRLDDLDAARVRPELVETVLRDLSWLGLDWDGEPLHQSADVGPYADSVMRLLTTGHAYACVCSRREIFAAASAPHAGDPRPGRYAGTCRGRFASYADAERETGKPAGIRFRVEEGPISIDDAFAGSFEVDVARETGDFLLARRDGVFAYQLAVVVDDARQGVTEVLRGEDLLESTARQRHIQLALGLPSPTWIHVPLVVGDDGERMAKRRGDLALASLREDGVDPRAVVGWAARTAGQPVDELPHAHEVIDSFQLDRVPRQQVRFGEAELESLRRWRV